MHAFSDILKLTCSYCFGAAGGPNAVARESFDSDCVGLSALKTSQRTAGSGSVTAEVTGLS